MPHATPLCRRCKARPATSEEHIVLDALGGRQTVRRLWCEPCNNDLGAHVDRPLVESLLPFSVLLGCQRGDGRPVAAWKDATARDGKTYTVLPGGAPIEQRVRPVEVEQVIDGRAKVHITGRLAEEVAHHLAHQTRRFGADIDKVETVESLEHHMWASPLSISTAVGGHLWTRAVAKMGVAAIAKRLGRHAVDSAPFDTAIALVDYPDDSTQWPLRSPVGINPRIVRAFAKSRPGEHLLLVYEPGGRSTEVAFLAFGCLPFRLRLAEGSIGLPATVVHRVNPLVGGHKARDLPGVPPLLALEKCSLNQEEARAAVSELLEFIRQTQDRRVVADVVAEAFTIFADRPEGAELTAADVGPLSDEVERLLRQRVRRESVSTPLDPELIRQLAKEKLLSMGGARKKPE